MLWKFNSVFDPALQLADHARPVRYELPPPPDPATAMANPRDLYVHSAIGRRGRAIDDATEGFVEATRMGGG
jgi:hypothetical protein